MKYCLVFLKRAAEVASGEIVQPPHLTAGDSLPLAIRANRVWSRRDVTRVIIGSSPSRADVLLVDKPLTIRPEHLRFYLNHVSPEASHVRPMKDSRVLINGRPLEEFDWVHPQNEDEIQIGSWLFRYKITER